MRRNVQKMFQEFVSYIDFPTVIYINETGKIIASNYHAELIIGNECKNVKELIESQLKNRFNRFILERVRQVFNNVVIQRDNARFEIDMELNAIEYGRQHIIICFFEQSYKMMYEKYLSLLVPRLFYKDTDVKYVYGSKYFLMDTNLNLDKGVVNEDFLDDDEGSRYIREIERDIIATKSSEYNCIHTIKVRGYKEYFAKISRMPVLDSNSDVIGMLGVYSIILNRDEYQGLFNATLRENQILNRIVSQYGKYVVSWKVENGWPIEYISSNFVDFGYHLLDAYNGNLVWSSLLHPDDYARLKLQLGRMITEQIQELPVLTYRIRKANGRYVWVEDTTYSLASNGKTYLREGMFVVLPEECYKELEKKYKRGANYESNKEGIW